MDFSNRIFGTKRTRTIYIHQRMHIEEKRYFGNNFYSVQKLYSRTAIQKEFGLQIRGLNSEIAAGRLEEIVSSPPIVIRDNVNPSLGQRKSPPLLSLSNYKSYY